MSILDNNILEETDIKKMGFPKKNEYCLDYRESNYYFDGEHRYYNTNFDRYWIIDNDYNWKQYKIKSIIISVNAFGMSNDPQDPGQLYKIIIGISKQPVELLIFSSTNVFITKPEYNKIKSEELLYLYSNNINIDWLTDEFTEWIFNSTNNKVYDIAYDLVNRIKNNPNIINKIIENKITSENKQTQRTLRLNDLYRI